MAASERAIQGAAALRRFNFSKWAVSLNSTPPGMERLLPPSDVRWRKDVRLLEQGQYEQVRSWPSQALLPSVPGQRDRALCVVCGLWATPCLT